jgi:mannobiose 2-epimerase
MSRPTPCLALASAALAAAIPAASQEAQHRAEPSAREALAAELDAYLETHVLAPRFPRCVDAEHGGFHENYARDWTPLEDRSRFVVYQARVTWTAATVARLRPERREEYLPYVRHGVRYLADVLWDREHGGFHTHVDLSGHALPGESARPAYGQAFAIYALAAAHAALGEQETMDLARAAWRFVEDHYRDALGPGYASAVRPDGRPFPAPSESQGDEPMSIEAPVHDRTMNDHIHLLEAYAELLRVWPDPRLRASTEELLRFVRDRLFVEPGCLYFALRPDGRVVPAPVSFGHDVETAFLLIEAEEALGREPSATTLRAARMLVDQALSRGFDPETGQLFEYGSAYGAAVDRSIQWWAQFEAFHALELLDERFGREDGRYRAGSAKAWALVRDTLADRTQPGVCAGIDARGEAQCGSKSHPWFASYHTSRALLLTADRLRRPR